MPSSRNRKKRFCSQLQYIHIYNGNQKNKVPPDGNREGQRNGLTPRITYIYIIPLRVQKINRKI